MLLTREIINKTADFTQIEMKFSIYLLHKMQNYDGFKNCRSNYIMAKDELKRLLNITNASQSAKKITNSIRMKMDDYEHPAFSYLHYSYPGVIEFNIKQETDTDAIDFDESLLKKLPNTGITLRLLLLLLFAIKDTSFDFTIDRLSSLLFGNKNAYNPRTATNASANQLIKLKNAIDELNTITDFFISIEPIKSSRSITGIHFNISSPNPTAICTNADTITKMLQRKKIDTVPQSIATFIALFATNDEAKELVQYITQHTTILQRAGIINKEADAHLSLARYAVLFPHKTPTLWYTEQRAKTILEHYMIMHPKLFVYDIVKLINNSKNYSDLVKNIKQNKKEK